jgi:methionyl-tRNA formyltransferase
VESWGGSECLESGDTLKTTYNRLSQTIEALCRDHWADLFSGKIVPQPQQAGGSCHRRRDIERVRSLLTKGWDTPVIELLGKGVSCDTVPIDPPEIGRN